MLWLAMFSILFLATGVILLRQANRQQMRTGLPQGRVIYADTGAWNHIERPFFSPRHRLTGKPDYLLKNDGEIVPIEIKSGTAPSQPYPSHMLQLAAYCLLVQETYNVRPSHGIVRYPGQTFAVDFVPELEDRLLATLDEIRQDAEADDVSRSHNNPAQCAACGYRPFCDQSLA